MHHCPICGSHMEKDRSLCKTCEIKLNRLPKEDQTLLKASAKDIRELEVFTNKYRRSAITSGVIAFFILIITLISVLLLTFYIPSLLREALADGVNVNLVTPLAAGCIFFLCFFSVLLARDKRLRIPIVLISILMLSGGMYSLLTLPDRVGVIEINTAEDFSEIDNYESGHYILGSDLHIISQTENVFRGILDGNGHSISFGSVKDSSVCDGLFSENFGTIKDLTICSSDIDVKGKYAAALCHTNNGRIEHCLIDSSVSLKISNSSSNIASFCINNKGVLYGCGSRAALSASTNNYYSVRGFVGGLAVVNQGRIECCYVNSTIQAVDGAMYIGGIAATLENAAIFSQYRIRDCYVSIDLSASGTGNRHIGVIAERSHSPIRDKIRNCWVSANIDYNETDFSYCIFDGSDRKRGCGIYAVGEDDYESDIVYLSTEDASREGSYPTFDFSSVWFMRDGRPALRNAKYE